MINNNNNNNKSYYYSYNNNSNNNFPFPLFLWRETSRWTGLTQSMNTFSHEPTFFVLITALTTQQLFRLIWSHSNRPLTNFWTTILAANNLEPVGGWPFIGPITHNSSLVSSVPSIIFIRSYDKFQSGHIICNLENHERHDGTWNTNWI